MTLLDDDDLRELTNILLISQKVKAREALCLRIGINPSELTFIREGSERDFVIQLINYLNQINDEEALCRLCCQELSLTFYRGKYASVLTKITAKLNCSQFILDSSNSQNFKNISLTSRFLKNRKFLLIIFVLILITISSFLWLDNVHSASTTRVYAKYDPWLAGMPPNSKANNCHISGNLSFISESPKNSPIEVKMKEMSLSPASYLTFTTTTENSVNTSNQKVSFNDADGSKEKENESPVGKVNNGFSSIYAPNGALLGVFIGEDPPNKSRAPDTLSFQTEEERNYSKLSPKLKQVFFIGDGKTDMDIKQKVIVPIGARHLYLGILDWCNWDDNQGYFDVEVTSSK
ncbi:MAG: hypothetical protein V7K94_31710 [Nostoc sp.]|uniref:hypothetical protein n=1 Tax=Nostoc sp. TaxID=1180 RepID=UPI002FF54CBC